MRAPAWLRHFGLSDRPFSKDIIDSDLWLPTSRKDVVDELIEAMHDHHHAVVVGDPGVGKTCTLRALRRHLPASGFRLTYCHNATLGRRDFYRHICLALGIDAKATAASVFWEISNHVEQLGREKVHPVFLLDEAQLLREQVLEHLHILSNYAWDQKPLLSIVLVGLPDLWRKLSLGIHRSLWSRIHCRISLEPPKPEDTVEYITYRLERVGGKANVFASDALALIHEATAGQLRDIDRVATACLRAAARRKLKNVDRELLQDVVDADTSPD
jgi:type II secretory pathway predicted ATPase ExeA